MEQAKKNLKTFSIFVLLFAGATLIQVLTELLLGDINSAEIPAGSPENILMITKMFLLVVTLIMLLPSVYVGCKGLKIAKKPNASKGHIVWATIILVFNAIGLISPVIGMVQQGFSMDSIQSVGIVLVDMAFYFEYIKYAKQVRELVLSQE